MSGMVPVAGGGVGRHHAAGHARAARLAPDELPNPAWLHGGTPSAGQQRFGAALLAAHGVVVLPSAVSKCSGNLVFSPEVAAGRVRLLHQQRLVVDTRLNRPVA
jgi:RES domain-containing protein